MFCKKADDTPCSFENKADDSPNKTRQHRSGFYSKRFKAITHFFPVFFIALVIVLRTAPIVAPVARKMAVTVTPYFLKISFIFSQRHGGFSFLNLSLQPRNLFVPLCYSCLCCFFVLGEGVFIIDSCLIFFIFLFKFFFMLINFF